MKNKELNVLLQSLNAVNALTGVKFAYAVSKNKKMLMSELEDLQESIKPDKEFIEYDKQRVELCEKYASKDRNGKCDLVNNQYTFGKDRKKFDNEVGKLNKKYSKVVDKRKKTLEEFEKLLDKESSFKPFMIDYSEVPKDITVAQMDGIIELINGKEK